jgi:pimeloyl-ACP methyl ester carboxylesterase
LHGTGASTHSFRELAAVLAERFTTVAIDLPGQGFSRIDDDFEPTPHAVAAAVVGAISQVRMAQDGNISFEDAVVAWALWSALWLVTAYIGSRYLSDEGAVLEGRTGGAP